MEKILEINEDLVQDLLEANYFAIYDDLYTQEAMLITNVLGINY